MTLLERCNLLRERIAYSGEFNSKVQAALKTGERRDWIDTIRRKVQTVVERGSALRDKGIHLSLPATHASVVACRTAVVGLRGKAGAVSSEAVLGDEAWRHLTNTVEADAVSLESHLRSALDGVQRGVRDLPLAGLQGIAIASGKEAEFRRLMDLKTKLLGTNWYDKTAVDLRTLLTWSEDLRNGADALSDIGAPEDVKRFLDSARDGKATIAGLTPSVRQWSRRQGPPR